MYLPTMPISSNFDLYMSCKVEPQNSQQKHWKDIEKDIIIHSPSALELKMH